MSTSNIFNRRYGGFYHIPQQRGRKIPHLLHFLSLLAFHLFPTDVSIPSPYTFRQASDLPKTPQQSELAVAQTGVDADRATAASLIPTYLPAYIHPSTKPDSPTTVDLLTRSSKRLPLLVRPTDLTNIPNFLVLTKEYCTNHQPLSISSQTHAPLFSFPLSCTLAKTTTPRIFALPLFLFFVFFFFLVLLSSSNDTSEYLFGSL